jgi:hypothetical protein
MEVSIPQNEGKLLARIEAKAKILKRAYERENVDLTVEGPESLLRQLQRYRRTGDSGRTSPQTKETPERLSGSGHIAAKINRPTIRKR